jgi:curved DNA-binding protein CbpA
MLKDHYGILGLPPSATLQDIKKAYRKLAQELHPDKTHGDPYAKERFHAVKEAYEVLSNPGKKSKYLQERWYHQSMGSKRTSPILTPETVLKQVIELNRYVRTLDVHRMDKEGLYNYMSEILSDDSISKLNEFNEVSVNDEIVKIMLGNAYLLDAESEKQLLTRLKKISSSPGISHHISAFQGARVQERRWESGRIWIVIFAALLLCLLIFFASR